MFGSAEQLSALIMNSSDFSDAAIFKMPLQYLLLFGFLKCGLDSEFDKPYRGKGHGRMDRRSVGILHPYK